jgi:hypothetical protein
MGECNQENTERILDFFFEQVCWLFLLSICSDMEETMATVAKTICAGRLDL